MIASADLLPDQARQPHPAKAQVVRLDERTLVAAWCSGFAPERGCHVTRISVDVGSDGSRPDITLDSDRLLPLCLSAT